MQPPVNVLLGSPQAGSDHSPGQQVSLPSGTSSSSWRSSSDSSSSLSGWDSTSGLQLGEPGGTGELGLNSPSSQIQPTCRMPPAPRSHPPTHLLPPMALPPEPAQCQAGGAAWWLTSLFFRVNPACFPCGQAPPTSVSGTAQGGLKLLAVQPTLLPTGLSPWHCRAPGQGQRPHAWPCGLRLPVASLCRWSPSGAAVLCMGTSLLILQAWLGQHVLRDSPSQPYVPPLHILKRSHCFLGPDGGQGCGPESD